jgi:hypothetical protein
LGRIRSGGEHEITDFIEPAQTFPASDPVAIDFEQFDSSSLDAAVESTRTDQKKPQSLDTSIAAGLRFISNARHETAMR